MRYWGQLNEFCECWIVFAFYCHRNMRTDMTNFPLIYWKSRTNGWMKGNILWQKRNSKRKKNNNSHAEIFPSQRQSFNFDDAERNDIFPRSKIGVVHFPFFAIPFRSVPSIDASSFALNFSIAFTNLLLLLLCENEMKWVCFDYLKITFNWWMTLNWSIKNEYHNDDKLKFQLKYYCFR